MVIQNPGGLPVVDLSGLCFEDQVFEYNLHTQVLPEISLVTVRVQFRCRRYVPAAAQWLQLGTIGPQFYLAA